MRVGIQIIYSRENTTALFDENKKKKKLFFLMNVQKCTKGRHTHFAF